MPGSFDGLVDSRLLTRKIKEAHHPSDSNIDLIHVDETGTPEFLCGLDDGALEKAVSGSSRPILRIFFLNVDGDAVSGKQFSSHALNILSQKAGMSKLLLSQMYQDSDWVGRFGNGCFVNSGWFQKELTFEALYYHCEPEFDHMLVDVVSTGAHTDYFIVNPTPNLFERLKDHLEENPEAAFRLFFPDILIADEVLKVFSQAAAEKWEELACLEHENDKLLPASGIIPKVEDLSLEWVCLSQGLTSTAKQLEFLSQSYARFFECFVPADVEMGSDTESQSAVLIGLNGREEKPPSVFGRGADDLLGFLKSKCQAQADWIGTSRESTKLLISYTQSRAQAA